MNSSLVSVGKAAKALDDDLVDLKQLRDRGEDIADILADQLHKLPSDRPCCM